ncbi:hypothetical protein TNCT_531631 [Trichonephila clavata]|uniref:Uncharacterized protein n=1 Tax=Trichonephila clavata TaxID=2740835 RepID=A0A8X6GID0_TRICU|nr:hypothetical protein TNCT_531631 [Trichonephila clavata]
MEPRKTKTIGVRYGDRGGPLPNPLNLRCSKTLLSLRHSLRKFGSRSAWYAGAQSCWNRKDRNAGRRISSTKSGVMLYNSYRYLCPPNLSSQNTSPNK